MRIAVCSPQVPFARGGAEILADGLGGAAERGHETDLVTVPFKWYPGASGAHAGVPLAAGRPRRRRTGGRSTSSIATKFPSYAVRHPHKVVWLVHQFRQAYELDRTELGQFGESAEDRAIAPRCSELDRIALGEAGSSSPSPERRRTPRALDRSHAEVVPHAAAAARFRCDGLRATSSSRSTGSTARSGSTC